jgi:hypothetical protein
LPLNQYDPADATVRQNTTKLPEHVHTVTTVTTDRTIDVPAPAPISNPQDRTRKIKVDNGFAIS